MTYTKTQGKTLKPDGKHRSDGSELIPAEVQENFHDDAQLLSDSASTGYTIDDEGLINNYAIEPDISASEYPSPQQQKRYIFLGVGAFLFVGALMLFAFIVS